MVLTLEFVLGIVRHFLTFGGGVMVTNGWMTASDTDAAIGAISTLIGIVWSLFRKWSREKDKTWEG